MAQRTAKTSSAAFHDAVSTWEKSVNGIANATMANDEFSGIMNQAMKLTLLMQQSLGNVMAVYLGALNLPTKAEVTGLGERLQSLELRMDRMNALLEHLAASVAGTTEALAVIAAASHPASSTATSGPAAVAVRPVAPTTAGTVKKPMPPRTKRPPARKDVKK